MTDRSFIGLMICVGLVGICSLTWLALPHDPGVPTLYYEGARETTFVHSDPKCSEAALQALEKAGRSIRKYECSVDLEEYRLKTNDLIQQTRAANAAQAQSKLSLEGLWLSFAQTLGGVLTLLAAFAAAKFARDAAVETRRGADAAHDDLQHSKDMSKIQLRAIMAIEHVEVARIDSKDESGGLECILLVRMKNFGQTSANSITDTWGWTTNRESECSEVLENEHPDERHVLPPMDLMVSKYTLNLNKEDGRNFEDGNCKIRFFGKIRFVDVFNENNEFEYYIEVSRDDIEEFYSGPVSVSLPKPKI